MKRRWLVLAMLLMGMLILAAIWLWQDGPHPEAVLTDGTIVRFEKAGVGTIPYDSYPPLKAALAGWVPNQFQGRLGQRFRGTFVAQPHEIGLLFSLWNADGTLHRDPSRFLSRIEFVESTGFVFNVKVSGYGSSTGMIIFREGPFPRRDPTLHMRLFEEKTDRLLLDLNIPNPGYKPTFPIWVPEALPAIQTVAPLTVTLKRGPADTTEKYLRDADLEITSTDPRWTGTQPQRQIWLTDATGNTVYDLAGLSPFEAAWKLHFRIRRNAAAQFGDDEVWRTKLVALPAALQAERLNLKHVVAGVELSAVYVTSAGKVIDDGTTLTVTPTTHSSKSGTSVSHETSSKGKTTHRIDCGLPFFLLTNTALDEDAELILVVRDQTGRDISARSNSGYSTTGGISTRIVLFEPTPETTDVQLEVTVNRGRTFEFLVAPRQPDPLTP